jgi:hypothetical protein
VIRAVPAERLAEERERMRPLPDPLPDSDRRFTVRVPPQPYVRVDTNDYSLDPRLAGRRVEITVTQRAIRAVALDTGEPCASHRRVSPATWPSPTPPTRRSSSACAARDLESQRSSCARWPATTA